MGNVLKNFFMGFGDQCHRRVTGISARRAIMEGKGVQHVADRLEEMLATRPFLEKKVHSLHQYVQECRKQIALCNVQAAWNAWLVLSAEMWVEEKKVAAAFMKFDTDLDGVLNKKEVKCMLEYLGFPFTEGAIDVLMKYVASNADNTISLPACLSYVGKVGGSANLFAKRRKEIERHVKSSTVKMDRRLVPVALHLAGIDDHDIAYWQLTTSASELEYAAMLEPCQQGALRLIRTLARANHAMAIPHLRDRVLSLNFREEDMYMALAWIREMAPIIIHVNLMKYGRFLKDDTHYRNQFEVGGGEGLRSLQVRREWEHGLFGDAYDRAQGKERVKYGVQNVWNDYRGDVGCEQYGNSYLVLKNVRLRCTLAPEDSGSNVLMDELAVPDYYAHVLLGYSNKELREILRVSAGGVKVGNSQAVIERWGTYKEAQIHGDIDLKRHVERLVVSDTLYDKKNFVESIAKTHGWKITWMKDMKTELESREIAREIKQSNWTGPEGKLSLSSRQTITSSKVGGFLKVAFHGSFAENSGQKRKLCQKRKLSSPNPAAKRARLAKP